MLDFDTIPGNEAVKNSLRAALDRRFPQTVLLTGPAGSGKLPLARVLAAALLCTAAADLRPCGTCSSCRKIVNHTHPDLDLIDEGSDDLPIACARSLRRNIHVLPNDGDRRVVILRHAHKLNPMAQNALLKVLEEPPAYAFFILTTEQPGAVLETIRSRCTRYQLAPAGQAETPDDTLVSLAAAFVHALVNADEFNMLKAAMALEKLSKPDLQAVFGVLQALVRDAILSAEAAPLLPALAAETAQLAARIGRARLLRLYDHIATLSGRTAYNAAAAIQCAGLSAGAYQICFL